VASAKENPERPSRWPPPLLRHSDQAVVAVILGLSLAAIGVWLLSRGAHRGNLIEIDRAEPQTVAFQIDINEADWPEFALLPGIGETLARRIVESREKDGPFLDHGDLQRVSGIGPKTLDAARPYLLPMPDAEALAGH
jgi:competence protein ComEA